MLECLNNSFLLIFFCLVDLIADAYENASKKDLANEDLLSHLFMAYVRLGQYKKQQQTAMNLYKIKPKNPYYFWSIMSLYMQVSLITYSSYFFVFLL